MTVQHLFIQVASTTDCMQMELRPLQIDFLFPVHRPHDLFVQPENSIKLTYSNYHVIIFSGKTRVKYDMNYLLLARADHAWKYIAIFIKHVAIAYTM